MTYKQTEIKLEETPLQKWKKAYTWWKSNKPQDEESRKSRELAGDMVNELETQKEADIKAFEDLISNWQKKNEKTLKTEDIVKDKIIIADYMKWDKVKELKEGLKSI